MIGASLLCRIAGAQAAQATIGKMVDKEKLDKLVREAAMAIEGDAKRFSPVDTGRLRNSIHYAKSGDLEYMVGTDVEYAIFQEYGTRYQSGTPFLRPAVEKNRFLVAGKARIIFSK